MGRMNGWVGWSSWMNLSFGHTNQIKFQVLIMQVIPSALDVIGALSIFLSAVAITFEKQIFKALCGRCCIRRQLDEDEENIIHEEEEEIE